MFYVYILKSTVDESIYTGYTDDLKRRFVEHNRKQNSSTKDKAPFQLIYYESYRSKADAKLREFNLKRHSGALTHLKRRIKNSFKQEQSM
jgi:putative endonuclease